MIYRTQKAAFTLAEVLITLGIIGVVAVLTLPTLIKNHQEVTWVNKLKKNYSLLEQGFQKMLADEEVMSLYDIPAFSPVVNENKYCSCNAYTPPYTISNETECAPVFEYLLRYFKGSYEDKRIYYPYLSEDNIFVGSYSCHPLSLSDGTYMYFYFGKEDRSSACATIKSLGGNMCKRIASVYIDVTGKRGANTWGKDMYAFAISDDGKLYPFYGKEDALYYEQEPLDNNLMYWRTLKYRCGDPNSGDMTEVDGDGCAARIIENGWKIDYLSKKTPKRGHGHY